MSNNVCLLILVGSLLLLLLSFERRTTVSGKEWTDEELRKLEKQWAEHDGEEASFQIIGGRLYSRTVILQNKLIILSCDSEMLL